MIRKPREMPAPNVPKEIDEVRKKMNERGYRPATGDDIKPHQEIVRIDLGLYYWSGGCLPTIGSTGATIIILDKETKYSRKGKIVGYEVKSPISRRSEILIEILLRNEYVPPDSFASPFRFFVKK